VNTIFALCSARGKSGVAVFRVSGPESTRVLSEFTNLDSQEITPRKLYFTKIYDPITKNLIDEGMAVFFKGAASFTGEDSLEFHTHGSIAVVKLLSGALAKLDYIRIAEPGEFARRAFLNGKFDLTAAEGLADLIDAETEMQHTQAIRQLGGGLEKLYEEWRYDLLKVMSLLEAYIDFPDEDIPQEVLDDTNKLVQKLAKKIETHLSDNRRGERLRSGLKLAIIGKPNVGKSSLLNFLMQRDVAIVSDIAGTTRDIIEGHLDIGGYPIILQDTAGIRHDTDDVIEQAGIARAKQAEAEADIKIFLFDASNWHEEQLDHTQFDADSIIVINKIDLINPSDLPPNCLAVSIKQNLGLDKLLTNIEALAEKIASPSESPQITRERHRSQLQNALLALGQFSLDHDLVLAAEDLRMTIRYLSNITGKITVDEILGEIFANFCIGK
jgi:tRNA modification GTPase